MGCVARWLVAVMKVMNCAYLSQGVAFPYRLEFNA